MEFSIRGGGGENMLQFALKSDVPWSQNGLCTN